jgi:hypothetical protein
VSYFRISGIEPVQRSVFADKKDVISKNVEFREIEMVLLSDFIFRAEVTKLFFYFINPVKRMFHVS